MSRTDTCTKCGRVGHTASSCPRYIGPSAPHFTEPHDGTDGMVRCTGCRRQGVFNTYQRTGCPDFVPSMADLMRHCARFLPLPTRRNHHAPA